MSMSNGPRSVFKTCVTILSQRYNVFHTCTLSCWGDVELSTFIQRRLPAGAARSVDGSTFIMMSNQRAFWGCPFTIHGRIAYTPCCLRKHLHRSIVQNRYQPIWKVAFKARLYMIGSPTHTHRLVCITYHRCTSLLFISTLSDRKLE